MLLFCNLLKVRVDDGHSEQDSSSAADRTHEVSEDAQSANAHTTEGCSGDDVPAEVLNHSLFAVSISNDHVLLHQLGDNITRGRAADVDPDAREDCTACHHKEAVDNGVEGVTLDVKQVSRRTDVVGKTTNWSRVASHVVLLPLSEETNEIISTKFSVQHLGEEVEV